MLLVCLLRSETDQQQLADAHSHVCTWREKKSQFCSSFSFLDLAITQPALYPWLGHMQRMSSVSRSQVTMFFHSLGVSDSSWGRTVWIHWIPAQLSLWQTQSAITGLEINEPLMYSGTIPDIYMWHGKSQVPKISLLPYRVKIFVLKGKIQWAISIYVYIHFYSVTFLFTIF